MVDMPIFVAWFVEGCLPLQLLRCLQLVTSLLATGFFVGSLLIGWLVRSLVGWKTACRTPAAGRILHVTLTFDGTGVLNQRWLSSERCG